MRLCWAQAGLAAAGFLEMGSEMSGNLRHPMCGSRPQWSPSSLFSVPGALRWGLCTTVTATLLTAPHTPQLRRRLAERLCCSPPPSPALKANLCSCGALAAGRLSASQMERHRGSPPFPARLLQTSSPHL